MPHIAICNRVLRLSKSEGKAKDSQLTDEGKAKDSVDILLNSLLNSCDLTC